MKPIKIKAFMCDCGSIYESIEECKNCCSKESPEEIYRCSYCNTEYDNIFDAEECCEDYVEEVKAFQCSECNEIYASRDDAKECCK